MKKCLYINEQELRFDLEKWIEKNHKPIHIPIIKNEFFGIYKIVNADNDNLKLISGIICKTCLKTNYKLKEKVFFHYDDLKLKTKNLPPKIFNGFVHFKKIKNSLSNLKYNSLIEYNNLSTIIFELLIDDFLLTYEIFGFKLNKTTTFDISLFNSIIKRVITLSDNSIPIPIIKYIKKKYIIIRLIQALRRGMNKYSIEEMIVIINLVIEKIEKYKGKPLESFKYKLIEANVDIDIFRDLLILEGGINRSFDSKLYKM